MFSIAENKNPEFRNNRVIQIYAPNGTMKTSLTKCFNDHKLGNESIDRDRVHGLPSSSSIKIDNVDIKSDQIFVVNSNVPNYESKNISRLLLNADLKKDYEDTQAPIVEKESNLRQKINALIPNAPKNSNLLDDIANSFYKVSKILPIYTYSGLKIISDVIRDFKYRETTEDEHIKYSALNYYILFHEKVLAAINKKSVKEAFTQYFVEYTKLVNNSQIYRFVKNGVFDHLGAENIRTHLAKDNFFNANHSIIFSVKEDNNKYGSLNINSNEDLLEIIEKEEQTIKSNETLKKSWKAVENALGKNQDVKDFATYIKNNIWLVNDLSDLEHLRKKVISSYFLMEQEAYKEYMQVWEEQEPKIDKIREQAKNEQTRWKEVIDIFHNRFHVPYKAKVQNSAPTILGEETAVLFFEHSGKKQETGNLIENVLSEGERRTLYLLNIIFDLLTLQEENQEQDKILIIDDIVDSFDYKNKHAILEYIYDVTVKSQLFNLNDSL